MTVPNLSFENENILRELVAKHDLAVHVEAIVASAMECAILLRGDPDTEPVIGGSRFGGVPDLPEELMWSSEEDYADTDDEDSEEMVTTYANFLMQINLSDLPALAQNPVPKSGILYFFAFNDEIAGGSSASILYAEVPPAVLKRAIAPSPESLAMEKFRDLKPYRLTFQIGIALPEFLGGVDSDASDRYAKLRYAALRFQISDPKQRSAGQILGYKYYHALGPDGRGRRLLWQFNSDYEVGMVIWDTGWYDMFILV